MKNKSTQLGNQDNKMKQINEKNTLTPEAIDIEKIVSETLDYCANSSKFEPEETWRRRLCLPRDHQESDLFPDTDEQVRNDLKALRHLPFSELRKPSATRFTCSRIGSVLVTNQNETCFILVGDIVKFSKLTSDELHDYIIESQFIRLDLIGAGGVIHEFVNWDAASIFCAPTPKGCTLIAWMEQVICPEILGRQSYADGIPTKLLYRFIDEDIEFDEWQDQFMKRHFPECPPPILTDSESIHISVGCAKDHLIENVSFVSLLIYIRICENEETPGDGPHESWDDYLLVAGCIYPDSNNRINAQILHYFLKFAIPFEDWISIIFKRYGHTEGIDYFTEAGVEEGQETIFLTVTTALIAAMATPTPRGQAWEDYCIATGLATPVKDSTRGVTEESNSQPTR
jgi:hypothetical protein